MDTTKFKDGQIIKSGDIWAAYKGPSPKAQDQLVVYFSVNMSLDVLNIGEHEMPKGLGWEETSLMQRDKHLYPFLDKKGYIWSLKKLIKFHG